MLDYILIGEYCLCDTQYLDISQHNSNNIEMLTQEFIINDTNAQIEQENHEKSVLVKATSSYSENYKPHLNLTNNASQTKTSLQPYIQPLESIKKQITISKNSAFKEYTASDEVLEKQFLFEDKSTFTQYLKYHKQCMIKAFDTLINKEFHDKTPNEINKIKQCIKNKKLPKKYDAQYINIVNHFMDFVKLYFNTKNIHTIDDMNNPKIVIETMKMQNIVKSEVEKQKLVSYKKSRDSKNYICQKNNCTFSSNKRYNFMIHMKSHLDYIVDFTCPYSNCNLHTPQVSNLEKHMIKKQKVISFSCDACDKSYSEKYNLKQHIKNMHIA